MESYEELHIDAENSHLKPVKADIAVRHSSSHQDQGRFQVKFSSLVRLGFSTRITHGTTLGSSAHHSCVIIFCTVH